MANLLFATDPAPGHLPWCSGNQDHSAYNGTCHGYAMARAFGHTWNDPVCPAHAQVINPFDGNYFITVQGGFKYINVHVHDIICCGDHSVYVTGVNYQLYGEEGYPDSSDCITVSEKAMPGDPTETIGISLKKSGYCPQSIHRRGGCLWDLQVNNSFGSGTIEVKRDADDTLHNYNSGDIIAVDWGDSITINTNMDEQIVDGYKMLFQYWYKGPTPSNPVYSKQHTFVLSSDVNQTEVWTAYFLREFNITFNNNFIGISTPGTMEINDTLRDLSSNLFHVEETYTIKAEAISQTINGIRYSFEDWEDSDDTNPRIFTPDSHAVYMATYEGTPLQVSNLILDCDYLEAVHITWDQHTNSNCQYKIYRAYKDKNTGQKYGPDSVACLNNNVTSYTDYDFCKMPGYSRYVLDYDVRAYYTVEETESPSNHLFLNGEWFWDMEEPEQTAELRLPPKTIKLSAFPNPFNPVTTIAYNLQEKNRVIADIYNVNGQLIKQMVNKEQPPGHYVIQWNGTDTNGLKTPSGVYFLRIQAGTDIKVHKLILMR